MSEEETLAGGQGRILPAHEQTGTLSCSSFARMISTRRGLNTRVHKQYTCVFAQSLSFILQNCRCISLHLYITLFFPSSLYTCHSRLTSKIPGGAPYLKLPISISSSRSAAALASPSGKTALGSTQPAPCTQPSCSAAAPSYPSPSKQRGCFPANALPALDYFLFTRIPVEPAPAC